MNESKISVRYSKALFRSAEEKGELDRVFGDMLFISEICRMSQVREILESPIIIPSKKTSLFHSILETVGAWGGSSAVNGLGSAGFCP